MKRFALIIIAALLALSLCACGGNGETVVQDGEKLAGKGGGNEAVDYTFAYPEDWELSENNGVTAIRHDCNPSDAMAEYASINVIVFSLSGSEFYHAKDYWESYEQDIQKTLNEYKLLDTEEITVDELPAYKVKYSAAMNERTYIFEQVLCSTGSDIYIITLTADTDDHEAVSPALKKVYESFRFE
ncbi:MAG: LpqN/LpqT family lipoprotein [Clostridia bacterium]|nr:LpqN/LpqT family lipoprotein [Clostridia bacterium]MBQ9848478.1 LpqN/LpqT family lipoprotein [Clostridia bacterium]